MNKIAKDVEEIESFLASLDFSDAIGVSDQNKAAFKATYKQFHSVLVWGLVAESRPNTALPVKIYFRETLSDLSQAFVLTLLHLYKPSRLCLRSSVENFVRSILLIKGLDVRNIFTVYDLFDNAKKNFRSDIEPSKNVIKLVDAYGELCKTAHSVKIDYMSLTVPFERLCIFQNARYTSNMQIIRNVSAAINQTMFWLWHNELRKAGHTNEDLVRDAVPKKLKRAVGNLA